MRLIVITPEKFLRNEALAIEVLFENGLEILHLRKPSAERIQVEILLEGIDPVYHPRIVLHDHFDLTSSYSLKGIHLNRRNPEPPAGYTGHISLSCHSLSEVAATRNRYDYVFLSPLFDSISKEGYKQDFSAEELLEARDNGIIGPHVVALGGMCLNTIPVTARYGFGGVAVLGTLWRYFKKNGDYGVLLQRFIELQALCNRV